MGLRQSDITYLVGAGVNRIIVGPDGRQLPMTRDFFQYALNSPAFNGEHVHEPMKQLLDFIARYWELDEDHLRTRDFDLEECFTQVELRPKEAEAADNPESLVQMTRLEFHLTGMLAECFAGAQHSLFWSEDFRSFGRRIFDERAAVLTFNYDTLLEAALEDASPPVPGATGSLHVRDDSRGIRIDQTGYSPRAWAPELAYKVRFDEVSGHSSDRRFVAAADYYVDPEREAQHPPFLKLHGSVNWSAYTGYALDGTPVATETVALHPALKTRLGGGQRSFNRPEIAYSPVEILLPLMITPVLNKDVGGHEIFRELWQHAAQVLRATRHLVVVGYSFPPTDFHVRRLLREAFAENRLDSLTVINPDTTTAGVARELCHFRKPMMVCRDIREYIGAAGV
jgi:hypothetical protein